MTNITSLAARFVSTPRRRITLAASLLAVFLLGVWNWDAPVLRLTSPLGNVVVLFGFFLLPWVAVVIIRPMLTFGGWRRVAFILAVTPLLAYSSFTAALIGCFELPSAVQRPAHLGFDPIQRVILPNSTLVLYLTDCGATCSFGLLLRQERALLPGVLLVRDLGGWYPAEKAKITRGGTMGVRVAIEPYFGRVAQDRQAFFRPRPWLYF